MSTPRDLVALLPHRPPMLLLDEAELSQDGSELSAVWNIPTEDPVLTGHFPGFPIWPGALLLESMAQTTAIYLMGQMEDLKDDEMPVLGSAEVRFLTPVLPGDTIHFTTRMVRRLGRQGLFSVQAVNQSNRTVARARVTAGIADRSLFEDTARAATHGNDNGATAFSNGNGNGNGNGQTASNGTSPTNGHGPSNGYSPSEA